MFSLFLDDERKMPNNFDIHVKKVDVAIALIKLGIIDYVSLNNDLGENEKEGKKVAQFIEQEYTLDNMNFVDFNSHTSNPVAKKEILQCRENVLRIKSKRDSEKV